jgi:hypothetical protein
MSVASRVWLSLAGFLLIAGAVYGFTSHEYAGAPLLLVGGATFTYLGLVGRSVVHRAEREDEAERERGAEERKGHEEAEIQVSPTIWPLAFAVTGLIIALGFIVSPWILVIGLLAFAVSAAGWLREVARGHPHMKRP